MVLTGDPGMGKTSLLQKLISEHGEKHSIGLVTNARYDIEHLLPWILLSLGLSQKRLDPVEAYHRLLGVSDSGIQTAPTGHSYYR